MSEKKRRLKKRHSTILMIAFAVAVCYFLITFIVMQSDIKSQEKYIAQLNSQLSDKKAENEELEKLVKMRIDILAAARLRFKLAHGLAAYRRAH